jgi:hypothetical protein
MLSIVATCVCNPNGSLPTILITSQLWLKRSRRTGVRRFRRVRPHCAECGDMAEALDSKTGATPGRDRPIDLLLTLSATAALASQRRT